MDEIQAICARYGVPVIEDAAQAIGAGSLLGRDETRWGNRGIWLFQLLSNQKPRSVWRCRNGNHPRRSDGGPHEGPAKSWDGTEILHEFVGGNFRLDSLQAAILLKKLPHLTDWSKRRWAIAQHYRNELANLAPELRLPDEPYAKQLGDQGHIYHQFVVRSARRDELREHLKGCGIGTEIYYPVPLHRQKCFAYLDTGSFPESEAAARQALALPIFPELTDSEIELVADAVAAFFKK